MRKMTPSGFQSNGLYKALNFKPVSCKKTTKKNKSARDVTVTLSGVIFSNQNYTATNR